MDHHTEEKRPGFLSEVGDGSVLALQICDNSQRWEGHPKDSEGQRPNFEQRSQTPDRVEMENSR